MFLISLNSASPGTLSDVTPVGQMSLGGTGMVILQAERQDLKEDISPPGRRGSFFPGEREEIRKVYLRKRLASPVGFRDLFSCISG